MKHASQYQKPLAAWLKKITRTPAEPFPQEDAVTRLVTAFLQWNATRKAAGQAYQRLLAGVVDHNDLRVSQGREVLALLGERYPQARERVERLHDVLQAIYQREHAVALTSLEGKSKKDQRHYFDTLPGMVPYVRDQLLVLNFAVHAVPVDDLTLALLQQEEVLPADCDVAAAADFLDKQVKAEEAAQTHAHMRAYVDAHAGKIKLALPAPAALNPAVPPVGMPPIDLPPGTPAPGSTGSPASGSTPGGSASAAGNPASGSGASSKAAGSSSSRGGR